MIDQGPVSHIRRHWAVFAGLAMGLAIWCAVDVSRRAVVDPLRPDLHMTDFTVYTVAGAAFFDGRAPYDVANLRGWKYLYPPLFALLVAPLAWLSPPWQATVWFVISVLLCLGSYFECRRLLASLLAKAPELGGFAGRLGIVAGAAVLFPTLNCLQRGQIGVILLYPLLLGFRLILLGQNRGVWVCGGVVLALPVVLKLTPLLPVVCLVLALFIAQLGRAVALGHELTTGFTSLFCRLGRLASRGERAAVIDARGGALWVTAGFLGGCSLFVFIIPASMIGWNSNIVHLHTWYDRVATKVDHDRTDEFAGAGSTIRNQSLTNSVQRFGNWAACQFAGGPDDRLVDSARPPALGTMLMDRPVVHRLLLAARVAAGVLLLLAVAALGFGGDRLSLGFALGLACVATLIVSPVARGHYFLLYLPAILFGGLWIRERRSARSAMRFAVIPMLLCLAHYLALRQAGRIGVLGIGTSLWFFAACTMVLSDALQQAKTGQSSPIEGGHFPESRESNAPSAEIARSAA